MSRLIDFLFNLHRAAWARGGTWHIEWRAMPAHDMALLLVLGVLAAMAAVVTIYVFEAKKLSPLAQASLITLRLITIGTVLVMLLEPVVVFRKTEAMPSNVILLVDDSTSMDLHDAYVEPNNAKAVAAAAKVPATKLSEYSRRSLIGRVIDPALEASLASNGDRIVHRRPFASHLLPTTTQPAAGDRDATAIGSAIKQAVSEFQGQPIAGVIVVTDGQSNTGESPVKAAEVANAAGVPVIPVAVGTPQGPRSAKITKLDVSPVVFVRDSSPVSVLVDSHGLDGQPATVVLERSRGGQPWEEIGRQPVVLGANGQIQNVQFNFSEPRPTGLQMRATLEGVGGELKPGDHTAVADVKAINQKIKVLFIAGETFPEVEFLRNMLLQNDKQCDAWTWLQSADPDYQQPCSTGQEALHRLPETSEELDAYDCVIMYDPDPAVWPSQFGDMLQEFVTKAGGGLVYIAGERNTKDLFDRPDDPALAWLNTLPVVVEPGLYHTDVTVKLSSQNSWKLDVTPEGKADPVFQFSDRPDENENILRGLPGMYWHFPVTRARAGATVLAVHGDPRMRNEHGQHVLLATQLVGPGRTFFVGFDSTYRWRYLDDRFFVSFWAHMIDRAGRNKQLGGRYPYILSTDRTDYRPGETVTLTAHFEHPSDRDAGIDVLHGEVQTGDDTPAELTLRPRPGDPSTFETTFVADKAGVHFVRVWAGDAEARAAHAATLEVPVTVPDIEFENPTPDLATMQAIARASGVRAFDLSNARELADAIKIHRVDRVLEDRQEIWDAPALYGLVFIAIVAEWVLRKKVQLV